jgi:hypothetical protein
MPRKPLLKRFLEKCSKSDSGCILWTGTISQFGYGRFSVQSNKYTLAHRWIWEQLNGPIPDGKLLMHTCDVRNCVNTDHLRIGTILLNAQDMVAKGRSLAGEKHFNAKLTEKQVKNILLMIANRTPRQQIADQFGVTRYNITAISRGHAWKHIPRPDMSNKNLGSSKLNLEQVSEIRQLIRKGKTGASIARQFNVSDGTVSMIKLGKTHN